MGFTCRQTVIVVYSSTFWIFVVMTGKSSCLIALVSAFLVNFENFENFAVLLLPTAVLQGSAKINVLLHFLQQKNISLFETIETRRMKIWKKKKKKGKRKFNIDMMFSLVLNVQYILQIWLLSSRFPLCCWYKNTHLTFHRRFFSCSGFNNVFTVLRSVVSKGV